VAQSNVQLTTADYDRAAKRSVSPAWSLRHTADDLAAGRSLPGTSDHIDRDRKRRHRPGQEDA
jgi:hypothetical protein